MAKGTKKKKKELTIEEKLEQALVPEEEWPYKVPENWCWVRFGMLSSDMADGPFGSNLKREHYTEKREVRIIQLSNVSQEGWRDENKKYTTFEHANTIARSIVKPGDIVITKMMPAGQAIICPNNEKVYVLSSDNVKMVPYQGLNTKYLVYGINSTPFNNQVVSNTQGITRARTSIKKLKQYMFPLCPLPEQQRIVNRIESLFAKLDEAKEKAQAVVDGYEDRKAAILYKAFTGELTEEWRKAHNLELKKWQATTVGECSELITKGASPRWQGISYTDDKSQTLFVTSENVREGFLDWSKEKYLDNAINEIQKRSVLHKGDVLVNIVGASIGRSAIFNRECLANTNQAVCLVRLKAKLHNEFLCHYFNSPFALMYYNDNKVETARANISLTNISEMPINLPSFQEQREIINRLNEMIEREEDINAGIRQVISQIDIMKKSILARAFRGELGTDDSNDEPAIELLKKVL